MFLQNVFPGIMKKCLEVFGTYQFGTFAKICATLHRHEGDALPQSFQTVDGSFNNILIATCSKDQHGISELSTRFSPITQGRLTFFEALWRYLFKSMLNGSVFYENIGIE